MYCGQACDFQPMPAGCTPCPARGSLAGLVVGSTGDADVAVTYGSCGLPAAGPAGVLIFGIDAGGAVTEDANLCEADGPGPPVCAMDQGAPAGLNSLSMAGASHWLATYDLYGINAASSTLPPVGGQDFDGLPGMIAGDAAGDTFVAWVQIEGLF